MTDLQKMTAIQDAIAILRSRRGGLANGAMSVWQLIDHAERALNANMKAILAS